MPSPTDAPAEQRPAAISLSRNSSGAPALGGNCQVPPRPPAPVGGNCPVPPMPLPSNVQLPSHGAGTPRSSRTDRDAEHRVALTPGCIESGRFEQGENPHYVFSVPVSARSCRPCLRAFTPRPDASRREVLSRTRLVRAELGPSAGTRPKRSSRTKEASSESIERLLRNDMLPRAPTQSATTGCESFPVHRTTATIKKQTMFYFGQVFTCTG